MNPLSSVKEVLNCVNMGEYSNLGIEMVCIYRKRGAKNNELIEYASYRKQFTITVWCFNIRWLDVLICEKIDNHYISTIGCAIFDYHNQNASIKDQVIVDNVDVARELFGV